MVIEQRRSSCRLIHRVMRYLRLNELKNAVAAFSFLQIEHATLQKPLLQHFFPAFEHTFNCWI